MSTVELTDATFVDTVRTNDIVVVDFWADWCGPCKMFAPVFDKASDKHPDVVFGKVDTEAQQALAATANIRSIPTLMVFREGVLLFSQAGALPEAALEDLIGQVKSVDMVAVRAEAAAASSSA